jgi:cytochrome c biogenesis protein CcmG/thiol:disulfide interchange protein DsbE
MNRVLFVLPLLTLAILAGFLDWSLLSGRDPASIGSVMIGRTAPTLPQGLGDGLIKSGKPVLVNFFASWCAPCLAEHPMFERFKQREGATIIGIAWKDKPEATRAWLQRLGDPFTRLGFDQDGRISLDWGLSGVPETYLIDAQGIVRLHFRGPITERDLAVILPLLKGGQGSGS